MSTFQDMITSFGELLSSLQQWFNSICTCDGYNNLYNPNLTCLDKQTGIITVTVHPNGLLSAQELIDLARADIQMRNPPLIYLTHGWILCLNISSTEFNSDDESLSKMSTMSIGCLCAIIALLICINIGRILIKHRNILKR